jgi:hypothetical protein
VTREEALDKARSFSLWCHARIEGPLGAELHATADNETSSTPVTHGDRTAAIWGAQLPDAGTLHDRLTGAVAACPPDIPDLLLLARVAPGSNTTRELFDATAAELGLRRHPFVSACLSFNDRESDSPWLLLPYERIEGDLHANYPLHAVAERGSRLRVAMRAAGPQRTWIWGIDGVARVLLQRLRALAIEPAGFIADGGMPTPPALDGLPVTSAQAAAEARRAGALVIVASSHADEILQRIHADRDWQSMVFLMPSRSRTPYAQRTADEQRELTDRIMRDGGTDIERWQDTRNLDPVWEPRAVLAARMIPAGSHVLDLGAGAQTLKMLLPPGCRYTPSDVVARTPDTLVADLNRAEFPAGRYDVVTALGVLEFIHRPDLLFPKMRQAGPTAIVSYCPGLGNSNLESRFSREFVNSFTLDELRRIISDAGWVITASQRLEAWTFTEQWLLMLSAIAAE